KIWDDVISIEDRRSLINGKNYVYRFVRENRWPVLDYVGKMGKINWTGFDIVVMENDTIFLNPNPYADSGDPDMNGQKHIYDPDEDELTYYYTGWKSTCSPDDEDWFDFDLGVPRLQCSRLEPSHPSSKFKFPMSTEVLDEEMTNAWMTSEPYLATGRNASYMPSHDDIGPHNVTIWVCDEAGLCDYQIVRIMVVDFPILHFNGTNPYEDISDEKASVEDFYRLSADGTTAYYTPLLGYVFTDGVEPFQVVIDHPLQIWDMPRPPPERARSIAWIHLYNFSQKALNSCGTIPCIHYINLSITSVSIPPEILNVSVYQCLPHMNPTPEGQLMWPYNVTNAFDASHLCCSVGDKVNNSFSYTVTPGPDAKRFSVPRVYKEDLDKVIVYKNGVKFCTKEAENQQQMCGGIKIYIEESMINIDMEKPFSGPDTQNCPPGAMCWVESPGAPAGNYTVEQISTIQRPPWGTYLGRDTTCYGGDPKIGAAQEMEINDIHHPMVENATAMTLGYWDDKWFNDIMAIIFERRCSGWRGNICNGPPMVTYHQVQECPDIDTDKGEIEHCQGPDYRIIEPKTLVETDPDQPCGVDSECLLPPGICNVKKGECYRLPTFYGGDSPYDCKLYGPGESFEKVFNISRKFPLTGLGNGTCNTRATCSDSLDEYDTSVTEGQYVLTAGAECFEGECKKPIAGGVQNCYDDSGWYNKEQGIPFCSKETDHYWTQAAKCVETSGVPECDLIEQRASRIDPDLKQQYCEGCFDPGALPESIYKGQDGGWTGTTCCGDDKGEGGWPYQGAAQRASGATTPEAGAYQATEICDDYYGSHPENPDSWIDNDCDGQYNCQDIGSCSMTTDSQYRNARTNPSQRAGRYGPSKGLCCTTDDQCRNFFFGYTYYYNSITAADTNVECSDINECECTKLDKLPPDYFWQLGLGQSTTTLNLCVAGDTFNGDRSIRLNPGTNTPARWNFEITVSDADNDGVDECQGKVNLIVMKVANNIPMPLGPGGVQVSNILVENPTFLVFTNIHEETCLINLIMTPA
ncbi:TPA: hypothetical protein HA265_02440, partial [Candidatus Woesearchaeota archaeon]|nr:hypothetical protein [Candidatus Woesearchaeota archaeon]